MPSVSSRIDAQYGANRSEGGLPHAPSEWFLARQNALQQNGIEIVQRVPDILLDQRIRIFEVRGQQPQRRLIAFTKHRRQVVREQLYGVIRRMSGKSLQPRAALVVCGGQNLDRGPFRLLVDGCLCALS